MVTIFHPLSLALITPFIGIGLLVITSRFDKLRDTLMGVVSFTLCGLLAFVIQRHFAGQHDVIQWIEPIPHLGLSFGTESLGLLFAMMVSVLWFFTILYSVGYVRANKLIHQTRFYCFITATIAFTIGLALSNNLLTLFVCYELITWSSFPLVVFGGKDKDIKAGRIYLGLLALPSLAFLLPALLLVWFNVGHLNFVSGGILPSNLNPDLILSLLLLFAYGLSKLALMPLHRWLPSAMVAPIPVSALLHAVAVVKAGAFALIKIVIFIFGYERLATLTEIHPSFQLPAVIAIITLLTSSIIALRKEELKQLLAYSTISQLSYIALATFLFTPKALLAAIFHLVTHGVAKIVLFFVAGNIATRHHKTKLSDMIGIGLQMPLTMGAFTLAALALIGAPLTFGFFSKWFMFQGIFENGNLILMIGMIASTLLNIAYFSPIVYRAFFRKPINQPFTPGIQEAPYLMVLTISLLSLCMILLFFCPQLVNCLALEALYPKEGL